MHLPSSCRLLSKRTKPSRPVRSPRAAAAARRPQEPQRAIPGHARTATALTALGTAASRCLLPRTRRRSLPPEAGGAGSDVACRWTRLLSADTDRPGVDLTDTHAVTPTNTRQQPPTARGRACAPPPSLPVGLHSLCPSAPARGWPRLWRRRLRPWPAVESLSLGGESLPSGCAPLAVRSAAAGLDRAEAAAGGFRPCPCSVAGTARRVLPAVAALKRDRARVPAAG